MAIFDFSNTRSRVTFLFGVLIAIAKHQDLWTNQECLYAIGALLVGLIVVSATGAIFLYWAMGNFKGVVAVMKRNADDPRAQWLGCGAIGFGGNRNEQKIKAVAAAGGADVVVAAMRAHAIYHGVQQEGCGALMALASDKEASIKVVSAGGVVSLLAALQYALGKANEGVLMKGMGALATLATTPANKEVLVKAGAADKVLGTRFACVTGTKVQILTQKALLACIKKFAASEHALDACCRLVVNLSAAHARNQEQLAAAGAAEVLNKKKCAPSRPSVRAVQRSVC